MQTPSADCFSAGGSAYVQKVVDPSGRSCISRKTSKADGRGPHARLSTPAVSPMQTRVLPRQPWPSISARPGQSPDRTPARDRGSLFPASMRILPALFQRRHGRSCSRGQPLHPPRHRQGCACRDRRRSSLSDGLLASMARSPGLRPLCDDPKLGGRDGGKKGARNSLLNTNPGPWRNSPATSRRTKSMTVLSASFLWSTANASAGWLMKSWITIPRRKISCDSSAESIKC